MTTLDRRSGGLLLHITSLPSAYGIGDLGPAAYRFADFLQSAGMRYWQLLPLQPTTSFCRHSPYNALSAFAGNPLLISPELLCKDNWLRHEDITAAAVPISDTVDYNRVARQKEQLLGQAYDNFKTSRKEEAAFTAFTQEQSWWLNDFALFMALKQCYPDGPWNQWAAALRDRDENVLATATTELASQCERIKFVQFLFFDQWNRLHRYCRDCGVRIIGDIPLYLFGDSADVWANPAIFKLDEDKQPTHVSGVPPDYFSETGQLWGNPVYNWAALKEQHYAWWRERLQHQFAMVDLVRVDHFRGLVAYWEVAAGEKTAMHGSWVEVPAHDFFSAMANHFLTFPIIAEDLGIITDDVYALMDTFDFPGMRVMLFGFDGEPKKNPNHPDNHKHNQVVYTGTHDNNTVQGWWQNEASAGTKQQLLNYINKDVYGPTVHRLFMHLAMASPAQLAIIPVQDVLGLGADARMNNPSPAGVPAKNWTWRLLPGKLGGEEATVLRELAQHHQRR